jgi:hypothetical protein
MVKVKKKQLIIRIKTKQPLKLLKQVNKAITESLQRNIEGEDIFNDPKTLDNMYYLLELQKALHISSKSLQKKSPKKKGK